MRRFFLLGAALLATGSDMTAAEEKKSAPLDFNPRLDLISLHYDHAPDKDDGQSAAADRSLLETQFGAAWLSRHTAAVSGAYGRNKKSFNRDSDAVMDAVWNARGGWIAADRDWSAALHDVFKRWMVALEQGGDVYVKEGGQSDLTAAVVARLQDENPNINPRERIHVVQHSSWNENQTTREALAFTIKHTHYVRIGDANRYLNKKGGNTAFEKTALDHPVFGDAWRAAFHYYPPKQRLDFSDTGELLHILGLGELGIDEFRHRFLDPTGE